MEIMTFEAAIKQYLDELAAKDELFAKTYAKKNKNIHECCQYIKDTVEKEARKSNTNRAMVRDEDVYNLAVHYYDEDDIVVKGTSDATVLTQAPATEKPKSKGKTRKVAKEVEQPIADEQESEDPYELLIPIF